MKVQLSNSIPPPVSMHLFKLRLAMSRKSSRNTSLGDTWSHSEDIRHQCLKQNVGLALLNSLSVWQGLVYFQQYKNGQLQEKVSETSLENNSQSMSIVPLTTLLVPACLNREHIFDQKISIGHQKSSYCQAFHVKVDKKIQYVCFQVDTWLKCQ